jgi:Tfp pilus assembly protein PilV
VGGFILNSRKQITKAHPRKAGTGPSDESGFSILETSIALVLMAIVGLGASALFFYAARNTVTAGDRDLAMAVAQQKLEQLRNVTFTDASLSATAGTTTTISRADRNYSVLITITDSNVVNGAATSKLITVRVTPVNETSVWARNITSIFGSVTLVSHRTALTLGPNIQF